MKEVRKWISDIGSSYNPEVLSSLKVSPHKSIYVNGFFCKDVKRLCIYCETMFGVDRYEVAKLFVKESPEKLLMKGISLGPQLTILLMLQLYMLKVVTMIKLLNITTQPLHC